MTGDDGRRDDGKARQLSTPPHWFTEYVTAKVSIDYYHSPQRDVMELPGYHYRTDALRYWEVLSDYVSEVLALTYTTDGAIINDEELLEFITEVTL